MAQDFEIVANSAASAPVLIRGLGFSISPGEVHAVEGEAEIREAGLVAEEIDALASDGAYPASPAGFDHSIQLRELPGSVPVAPAEVRAFLDRAPLTTETINDFESGGLLGRAIFTSNGGMIYDSSGDILLKEASE